MRDPDYVDHVLQRYVVEADKQLGRPDLRRIQNLVSSASKQKHTTLQHIKAELVEIVREASALKNHPLWSEGCNESSVVAERAGELKEELASAGRQLADDLVANNQRLGQYIQRILGEGQLAAERFLQAEDGIVAAMLLSPEQEELFRRIANGEACHAGLVLQAAEPAILARSVTRIEDAVKPIQKFCIQFGTVISNTRKLSVTPRFEVNDGTELDAQMLSYLPDMINNAREDLSSAAEKMAEVQRSIQSLTPLVQPWTLAT